MTWFTTLRKINALNPGIGPNWDPFPYLAQSNLAQAIAMIALWVVLLWAWAISIRRNPSDTLSGGAPSRTHWILGGIVFFVTLYATLTQLDAESWLLGVALAMGALLSTLNPAFALSFSVFLLTVRPWDLMIDNPLALELPRFSVMFSIAWGMFYFFAIDRFRFRVHKTVFYVLAFTGWTFLATFRTPNPAEAQQLFNNTLVRAIIMFFLIFHLTRDRFTVWVLKLTIVIAIACMGVIGLIFYFNGLTETGRLIGFGLFGNSNDVGACMVLLIAFCMPAFMGKADWSVRFLYSIPMSIALIVLKYTQSRGAILSVMAMGSVYLFMKMKNKLMVTIIAGCIFIGGYGAMKVLVVRNAEDMEGSSENRMAFVVAGMRMALYNPVFGVGFGEFPANYDAYTLSFEGGEWGERTAHNSWVLALAETGPVGLILFCLLYLVTGLQTGIATFKEDPAWLMAFVGYTVTISFLSHTFMMMPYMLIGGLIAASLAFKKTIPNRELSSWKT